MRNNIYFR